MSEIQMMLGDSAEKLKEIKDNSVDMLCSDPPYGYSFMNKGWDKVLPDVNIWRECFRVLKPYGTLIFKWNETSISLKDILKLTSYKPIIGHPSGKRMGTHWVLFIK